jgi:DMSO/TMAO reductase YedYZ molybdopterin-dependent catalytic subunit
MAIINKGFRRKREAVAPAGRVPPGQYVTMDFPVLSAGPTPRVNVEEWGLTLLDRGGQQKTWSWSKFMELPSEQVIVDIHCVTKWSKLDTAWEGVSIDTLLDGIDDPGDYLLVRPYGGYTTNLPTQDVTDGKAWIAFGYDDKALTPEHGGPARLLVPHLYFWKSAKWVNGLEFTDHARRGFWESYGYHDYGDPWLEQRYSGD